MKDEIQITNILFLVGERQITNILFLVGERLSWNKHITFTFIEIELGKVMILEINQSIKNMYNSY